MRAFTDPKVHKIVMLVEIGAAGNSLEEALAAARVFGEGFAEVVTGAK